MGDAGAVSQKPYKSNPALMPKTFMCLLKTDSPRSVKYPRYSARVLSPVGFSALELP